MRIVTVNGTRRRPLHFIWEYIGVSGAETAAFARFHLGDVLGKTYLGLPMVRENTSRLQALLPDPQMRCRGRPPLSSAYKIITVRRV